MQKIAILALKAKSKYDEIHPKVKTAGKTGVILTALVAGAEAAGVVVPNDSGVIDALGVLAVSLAPVIAGYLKRA